MNIYVEAIIYLLSGLGILMVGFKLLSDNIEKLATSGLKKMFSKKSKNYIVEVGIGALATAIIHSSAASTVMIVGFVNAGLMNLFQATAMIMGANIGTTITAQVVALGSFDFSTYAMLLSIIGIFMSSSSKNEKVKDSGLALSGLGLVFIALKLMSDSMNIFSESAAFSNFLSSCNNPVLLLLFGIVITALIQSSTAVTTIVISMAAAGISIGSEPNAVLYVILGSNIGTCVTALLSSLGANKNAKRASLIHLMFNVGGAIIFFILLVLYKGFMADTLMKWFPNSEHPGSISGTQIAMFHTIFNVVCVCLFLPFINLFVKTAEFFIKDDKKEELETSYIDDRFLRSPAVAIGLATKETLRLGKIAVDTLALSIQGFIDKDLKYQKDINEKMSEIDLLNQKLLAYLIKISGNEASHEVEESIALIHKTINDFYREIEIADNMLKYTRTELNQGLVFSPMVFTQLKKFKSYLLTQYDNIMELYNTQNVDLLKKIDDLEDEIDKLRSMMINQHIERLEKNECSPANSGVFINLVSNLERAGDHLNYIAHSLMGK